VSDYRAVAAVTATLQNMLQASVAAALPGAIVKTGRPAGAPSTTSTGEVNIFLYQVTPNPSFRNADLATRRSDGTLIRAPQVALDLHYLLSFYGDDVKLIPQLLLGVTASTMHAFPHPRPEDLPGSATGNGHPLAGSGIERQMDRLRFAPITLTHEELSKMWSVFFQVPYTLSIAYMCSVVLIEADLTPQPSMPLRGAAFTVQPQTLPPQVDQVSPQAVSLEGDARITLRGRNLRGDDVVRIGEREVAPESATVTTMSVALPGDLRAGVQTVRVVRRGNGAASSPVAFVLRPAVTGEVRFAREGEGISGPTVLARVTPPVAPGQRAALLLNETGAPAGRPPRAYSFTVRGSGGELAVSVPGVEAGTYLVRVEVDGIVSELVTDTDPQSPKFDQYVGPKVVIP
jgi:uncharacterized protein DUF4255/IPT/TIG domain-containing protein